MEYVTELLQENKEEKYAIFQRKLIPNLPPECIIGVRTPILRKMAKQIIREGRDEIFMAECPHEFFEENQLHGFIISERKDFKQCMSELENFLPYINNWATCDQTSPKIFKKNKEELFAAICRWLSSDHAYTVRFAVNMLMQHFLDDDFTPQCLEMTAGIKSEDYYVNMGLAWYLATALAKQWDSTIPYIETNKLAVWVHNRTIQKARESYRITQEQKTYLKGLKR
jgi:3-methyladenine DNA glycosylase AlkD